MENPNSQRQNTFVVGLFVFIAFLVLAGFVVFMGGTSPFSHSIRLRAFFRDIRGLNVGAPVFYSGIQVGRVSGYQFPTTQEAAQPGQDTGVFVVMDLFSENKSRVRQDSQATISTQGVLGDKVIVIKPGSDASASVKDGMTLVSVQPKELGDYFSKGGDLVENLNVTVQNLNMILTEIHGSGKIPSILNNVDKLTASLATTSKNLEGVSKEDLQASLKSVRHILEKIDKGEGTLGALINDPSLHEDLRVLVGGAQRSKMVRFLIRQAISNKGQPSPPPPSKTGSFEAGR